ncbi:MAG: hypothetical protein IPK42_25040 [Betaproteobacteria bacterium]|nr:hypothetical protein [Betaproteobacteria bacterium]
MTLPPMPQPDTHCLDDDTGKDVWSHSADQMRAYAELAVAAERERCAAICDARSADHWRAYSDKSSPHFCDARFEAFSDEAEECATLIRGDNAKVSGAGTASAGLPG